MNTRQIEALKAHILATLARTDKVGQIAITTALVRLFARQTSDEQVRGTTVEQNGRGFSMRHAKAGSYMARWALGSQKAHKKHMPYLPPTKWDEEVVKLKAGQRTTIRLIDGRFLNEAREIAVFYHKQLVEEAVAKLEAKEQKALIAAQSEPVYSYAESSDYGYCDSGPATPDYESEKLAGPSTSVPTGDECPDTVRSPRAPYISTERPIQVSVL